MQFSEPAVTIATMCGQPRRLCRRVGCARRLPAARYRWPCAGCSSASGGRGTFTLSRTARADGP